MSIRKCHFLTIVQTQNFTDKNVPQRRVCFKEFQKKNKCHELQNLKDEKKYTVGWLSAGLWSG
ncbi:MAG: hypothetical protein K5792_07925, partial [Butyrivibrio sp.]|nr:hypothetical protein [Butyrivibrio sp.]